MMVASVVFPSPGGPYNNTWSSASARERAASIATARFSLTFVCPMNSPSRCGRSFSSNEESSSTGAAETTRSFKSGSCLTEATGRIVRGNRHSSNCGLGARLHNGDDAAVKYRKNPFLFRDTMLRLIHSDNLKY